MLSVTYTDKYKDKFISVLGDSISTFEGVSEPKWAAFYNTERKIAANLSAATDTWWGKIIERLGAKLLVNNSISGSTVTWHSSYQIQSYGCSDERTRSLHKDGAMPNVIIVYLGTNDWGAGVPISGNKNNGKNNGDNGELAVFSTAYRTMIEKLRKNYPKAEIWCLTLAVSCFSKSKTFEFPYYNGGWHIVEYCESIRACASENGCKVIDLYKNAEPYDTIDCFHPNGIGMETIATAVLKNLSI